MRKIGASVTILAICGVAFAQTGYVLSKGRALGIGAGTPVGSFFTDGAVWNLAPGSSPAFLFNPYFATTALRGRSGDWTVGDSKARAIAINLSTYQLRDITPIWASTATANAINGGTVAGVIDNQAAAWSSISNASLLPALGTASWGSANGASGFSTVVGTVQLVGHNGPRAYHWTRVRGGGWQPRDLTPAGTNWAEANAIDFGGRTVGGTVYPFFSPQAAIWDTRSGATTILNTPGGGPSTVLGTNGKWHVGWANSGAALWIGTTNFVNLHASLPPAFVTAVIVGYAMDRSGDYYAVYWK
jgi:hypothetical protein